MPLVSVRFRRALLLGVLALLALPARAQEAPSLDPVLVPLHDYLQGHATGDGDAMRRAFHPAAQLFWIADGAVQQLSAEDFAARFSGQPPPDEDQRHRRIASLDVTGDVAVARVELDYPNATFTDYMTLVREGGEWKIINKTFYRGERWNP
ncbi:MAG: nuclear transport factor 2 family protein [Rubricoccaceae bacterium]|nr:nuclear transport factor 2 family protein [Rubricoccaceae bacterium]